VADDAIVDAARVPALFSDLIWINGRKGASCNGDPRTFCGPRTYVLLYRRDDREEMPLGAQLTSPLGLYGRRTLTHSRP
jgi:hypothetical protein